MNCTDYQKQILLAASREPHSRDALAEHLSTCDTCRAFAHEEEQIAQIARDLLPDAEPHPDSLAEIRKAAADRHSRNVIWFPVPLTRIAAYAAMLLAIAGGTTWIAGIPARQRSERISELSSMVAMVSDTLAEDGAEDATIPDDRDLKAVARQLLEMEGFAVDDLFGDDEELTQYDLPDPTTTQWRRTHVLPAGICV